MPYGLPKQHNTEKNNNWIENCVSSITGTNKRTGKPYKEGERIAICKYQLRRMNYKTSEVAEEKSLRDIQDMIYKAIEKNRPTPSVNVEGPYVVDIFDDYLIISNGDSLFKVPYTISEEEISVDWSKSIKVEKKISYDPIVEVVKASGRVTEGYIEKI